MSLFYSVTYTTKAAPLGPLLLLLLLCLLQYILHCCPLVAHQQVRCRICGNKDIHDRQMMVGVWVAVPLTAVPAIYLREMSHSPRVACCIYTATVGLTEE